MLKNINFLLWEYRLVNEPILYKVSFKTNGQNWKSIGNIFDQEIVPRNRLENKTLSLQLNLKNFSGTFLRPKKFLRGWPPFSEHSKIPISTHFIRIHWCLFWLLGFTWETWQTSLSFFGVYTFYQVIFCITWISNPWFV